MITAVLTADCHLGTYYSRLRPDRLHQRRERLQAAFRGVVSFALERGAQLFLIAGDLFDRPDPRNADRAFVAEQLARLRQAGVTVVAICGNHDSPRMLAYDGGVVPLEEMEALDGLHLLREDYCWSEKRLTLKSREGADVTIRVRGVSYNFQTPEDICPLADWTAALPDDGDTREAPIEIALLHYPIEGWQTPHAREPVLTIANLEKVTADLIGVGHLHVKNCRRLDSGALLLNPGATERIHFGEESHTTGCYVAQLVAGKPVEAEYVPLASQPMQTVFLKADSLLAALELSEGEAAPLTDEVMRVTQNAILEALGEGNDSADTLLRIVFSGVFPEDVYNALDANALRQWAQTRCFHCEVSLEDAAVRYRDMEIVVGAGGFEIDREIETVVEALLAQVDPDTCTTEAERRSTEKRRKALQTARETLLTAYQQIRVN